MPVIFNISTIKDPIMFPLWEQNTPFSSEKFPPPITWDIFCLGYMLTDEHYNPLHIGVGRADSESELNILHYFNEFLNSNRSKIVTWNGRAFDLPVMLYRSMHYNIPMTWYFQGDCRSRFSSNSHLDLADYLSNYTFGNMPKLDYMAKLIGLPENGISGEQIEDLYNSKDYNNIVLHCIHKILQTYVVYLHTMFMQGDLANYQAKIAQFREFLVKTIAQNDIDVGIRFSCKEFLEKWT